MFAQLSTLTLARHLPVSCCSLITYQVEPLRLFHPTVGDLRNLSHIKQTPCCLINPSQSFWQMARYKRRSRKGVEDAEKNTQNSVLSASLRFLC